MKYHDNLYEAQKIVNYIMKRENLFRGKAVLDAGGGTGHLLYDLPKSGFGVVLDKDRISLSKSKVRNRILADLAHLPLIDNIFDLSIFVEVIEHLEQPQRCVCELNRVSRNVILTTPNNSTFRRILWKLRRKGELSSPDHIKEYSPKELENLFQNAGFVPKAHLGVGFIILRPRFLYDLGELVPYLASKTLMEFSRQKPRVPKSEDKKALAGFQGLMRSAIVADN